MGSQSKNLPSTYDDAYRRQYFDKSTGQRKADKIGFQLVRDATTEVNTGRLLLGRRETPRPP